MRVAVILRLLALSFFPTPAIASGLLEFVDAMPSGCAPSQALPTEVYGALVSPDGADMYVTGNVLIGHLRRDAGSGAVTKASGVTDGRFHFDGVVTPDGAQVLVVDPTTDELQVFDRDAGAGDLTLHTDIVNGVGGVTGMSAYTVTVTPDSVHAYVARNAISRFERDAGTGDLTYLGNTALPAVGEARHLEPSVDGLQVYALGANFDLGMLDVWSRDPGTGDLTLLQHFEDGSGGVSGLEAEALVVSPDGTDVYTLGDANYPNGVWLAQFRRAPATGLLTFAGSTAISLSHGVSEIARMTIRPDGAFVYVTQSHFAGALLAAAVFARDLGTGALTAAGTIPLVPVHVATTAGHLYGTSGVLGPNASRVTVHRIDGPTGIGPLVDFERPQATVGAAVLTADDVHLYVHCPQEDAVVGFAVDPGTGALTAAGKLLDGRGGLADESEMAVSPDGAHVYVASLHGDGIAALARNPGTGALSFASAVLDDQAGIDGLGNVHRLAIAPDGGQVYATTDIGQAGADEVVSVFSRNAGTGALTPAQTIGQTVAGLTGDLFASDVTISPDGANAYLDGSLDRGEGPHLGQAGFSRNPTTGVLTYQRFEDVSGESTAGPDGRQLYVTRDGAVTVLQRNPVDGALVTLQIQRDDAVSVETPVVLGATSPWAHALADRFEPFGGDEPGLVTWRRDPATGRLSSVQTLRNGVGGTVLGQPTAVASTADGRFVYVPDGETNTIARFRHRQPCTPAPQAGCRVPTAARAASLTLKDKPGVPRKLMTLRWTRGTAVTQAEVGTPTSTTEYVACLYDAAGSQPVTSVVAPAGSQCGTVPCWKPLASGFQYSDRTRTGDGLSKATVTPGGAGQSRLLWKASGASMPPLGLPLQTPVVFQIQASNGTCWEAVFSTPSVNDGLTWKGKSD